MPSKLQCYVDRCPECLVALNDEAMEAVRSKVPDPRLCSVFVCCNCGHLILCGLSTDGERIESGKVPSREFLYEHFEKVIQNLRDLQEDAHHKNGHWG